VRHREATRPAAAAPRSAHLPAAMLVAIVVLAIPISWLTATLGFTIAVVAPARDVALLLLWSTSEEIVFRGGLQPLLGWVLARATEPGSAPLPGWSVISIANLVTSLLFCAAHLLNKPVWVVLGLFPVSLLLGASLERSGRLWVPVALHAYFNLLLYAASALASS
jgi:membrane protease YdiL (CAAX protease family)